jgi:hypothetical protein
MALELGFHTADLRPTVPAPEFAFVGIHRLEAGSAVQDRRGNSALRKIGAAQEGILRKSFLHEDWYRSKAVWGAKSERVN